MLLEESVKVHTEGTNSKGLFHELANRTLTKLTRTQAQM